MTTIKMFRKFYLLSNKYSSVLQQLYSLHKQIMLKNINPDELQLRTKCIWVKFIFHPINLTNTRKLQPNFYFCRLLLFSCKKVTYIWDGEKQEFTKLKGLDKGVSSEILHRSKGLTKNEQFMRYILKLYQKTYIIFERSVSGD